MQNIINGNNVDAEEEAELIDYLLDEDFDSDDEYHPDNIDSPDYGPIGYWDKKRVVSPPSHSELAVDPFAFDHIASAGFDPKFDDIATIIDENASYKEQMLASVFLLNKPLKASNKIYDAYKIAQKTKKSKKNIKFNRKEAINNAKELAGIPKSQQPNRQWRVGDNVSKKGGYYRNYDYSSNRTHHGRYYEYDTPHGKRVIVEHTNDGLFHTHAGKPKAGANPFEYDFKKERYTNMYDFSGDHHIYYNN